MIVNKGLGPAVQGFQYPACSGARTEGIRQQAAKLAGNLDLVMMTAGGNDLCLAAIIKECVFLPYKGEQVCQDVLDKAQLNINTILKPNLETILNELDSKMKDDAILVLNGYAPFFKTENEDCADPHKHDWAYKEWWGLSYWTQDPLPLSAARRNKFNTPVANINKAIKEVVEENDGVRPYRIVYGDWSGLPAKVDGQMCSPRSTGHYPDPEQEGLLFFKPDTHVHEGHIGLRRRIENGTLSEEEREYWARLEEQEAKQRAKLQEEREMYAREMKERYPHNENIYDSLIFRSANPAAEALHRLDPRAAAPPNCPGDGSTAVGELAEVLGLGLPDSFLSNFHPNERGHEAIAAVALDSMIHMRAKVLSQEPKACRIERKDEFRCNGRPRGGDKDKPHVSFKWLDYAYKYFCDNRLFPANAKNWKEEELFYKGFPDEVILRVTMNTPEGQSRSRLDRKFCEESFEHLTNRCDGNDLEHNPLNVKFGGKYVRGDAMFEIIPNWFARPIVKRHEGRCNSHYYFYKSRYVIVGNGWGNAPGDQNAISNALIRCGAFTAHKWEWNFCHPKDREPCEGYEWKWVLESAPLIKARCFDNLKVAKAGGGYYHRYKKKFEDYGCAGSDR